MNSLQLVLVILFLAIINFENAAQSEDEREEKSMVKNIVTHYKSAASQSKPEIAIMAALSSAFCTIVLRVTMIRFCV